MNFRPQLAYELRHTHGLTYAQIGEELGIRRQSAYDLVKRFENLEGKPGGKALATVVAEPTSQMPATDVPATVTPRWAVDNATQGGWTPSRLANMLASVRTLENTADFFSFAEEIEEKDANFRSVIGTRKLGVAALQVRVSPPKNDASRKARKIAEFVQEQYDNSVADNLEDILDAYAKGISFTEIIWDTSATQWTVAEVVWRDPRHFVFSKKNGKQYFVAPDQVGGAPTPLPPNKFIVHTPKLKAGFPVRAGLAVVAGWCFVLKWLAKRDWASLSAVYGKPVKVGKYKPGTDPNVIAALRQAVAQLGSDAAAVVSTDMVLEFVNGMAAGNADVFERFIRYLDEQVAKLVLGASLTTGTSNTGSGGSQALGTVHAELRYDILKADARALSRTLQRDFVRPLVQFNFGADAPMPTIEFVVEENEDIATLTAAAERLGRLGVPLSKKKLAARLGLELADEDEPEDAITMGAPAAEPPDDETDEETEDPKAAKPQGAKRKRFAAQKRDPIAELAAECDSDWEADLGATLDAALAAVAAESTSFEDLRQRLANFCESGDLEQLRVYLTKQRTKTALAGEAGVSL